MVKGIYFFTYKPRKHLPPPSVKFHFFFFEWELPLSCLKKYFSTIWFCFCRKMTVRKNVLFNIQALSRTRAVPAETLEIGLNCCWPVYTRTVHWWWRSLWSRVILIFPTNVCRWLWTIRWDLRDADVLLMLVKWILDTLLC